MKKFEFALRKFLRTIFGCISFTAIAFVFQACYGTGPDRFYDVRLSGIVKSKATNLPIKGIKVIVNKEHNFGITDRHGKFDFYASVPAMNFDVMYSDTLYRYIADSVKVHFQDIDGIENGYFADKTIIINPARKDEVEINVVLDNQQ